MHCDVLRYEVAVRDEVKLLESERSEVLVDGAQDGLQAVPSLRSRGVVDHIRSDEIVDVGFTARLLTAERFFDDGSRASLGHVSTFRRLSVGALGEGVG